MSDSSRFGSIRLDDDGRQASENACLVCMAACFRARTSPRARQRRPKTCDDNSNKTYVWTLLPVFPTGLVSKASVPTRTAARAREKTFMVDCKRWRSRKEAFDLFQVESCDEAKSRKMTCWSTTTENRSRRREGCPRHTRRGGGGRLSRTSFSILGDEKSFGSSRLVARLEIQDL